LVFFVCRLCDTGCSACEGNGSNCSSCVTIARVPYFLSIEHNACYLSCPSGQYGHNNLCLTCVPGCLTCFGSTINDCNNCTTANISGVITPFYLNYGTNFCDTVCPYG
jgi:hypothetical protein